MIILGMTGPIGHGKSTFAKAVKELEPTTVHLESSLIIAEIANAMHAVLHDIPDPYDVESLNNWLRSLPAILLERFGVHCTYDQIKLDQAQIEQHPVEYQKLILHVENLHRTPGMAKQPITKENKESYRPLLQWLGGYLVQRVSQTIWYDEILRRIYDAQSNGAKLCIVGGLRYPSDAAAIRHAGGIIIKVYRPGHLQNDMLDPTERERDNIPVDCTIMSNGTIDDVKNTTERVLDDIRNNRLASLYQTAAQHSSNT
jgi:hypothetical protein